MYHGQLQKSRKREPPEVVVFEEPKYASRSRSGKQAAMEREKFLVSRSISACDSHIGLYTNTCMAPLCIPGKAGNVMEIFASGDDGQGDSEEMRRRQQPALPGGQEEGLDLQATLREVQALGRSASVMCRQ